MQSKVSNKSINGRRVRDSMELMNHSNIRVVNSESMEKQQCRNRERSKSEDIDNFLVREVLI